MYTLTQGSSVIRDADGVVIPDDNGNLDWRAYQLWLSENNTPTPYVPPVSTLLLTAPISVQITSTLAPSLNGAYPLDQASQLNMTAESLYIQVTTLQGAARFTNGQTTRSWADVTGASHTFTTDQFIAFAEAYARFLDAIFTVGQTILSTRGATIPPWPSQPISIP